MDGFRERLNGRYDRSGMRGSGYERMGGEDRYESDRYERAPRRSEGISLDALNDTVNDAITKANQEQLNVIADFFDEAKADRMESERAIIDALSHSINDAASARRPDDAPAMAAGGAAGAQIDGAGAETLARIERIAGQNAESLNESSEMLERSVEGIRSNTEILNDIRIRLSALESTSDELKSASGDLSDRIRESISEMGSRGPAPVAMPMQDLTVDFSAEKEEIIGAVGDNRAILNMIRQDVLNGFAKKEAEEESEEGKPVPLSSEDAANYYKELEDHVHKEAVKCYRNVQSALSEQGAEANKGLEKSVAGMRIMVLLALIFGGLGFAASLVNLLANMGILPLFN